MQRVSPPDSADVNASTRARSRRRSGDRSVRIGVATARDDTAHCFLERGRGQQPPQPGPKRAYGVTPRAHRDRESIDSAHIGHRTHSLHDTTGCTVVSQRMRHGDRAGPHAQENDGKRGVERHTRPLALKRVMGRRADLDEQLRIIQIPQRHWGRPHEPAVRRPRVIQHDCAAGFKRMQSSCHRVYRSGCHRTGTTTIVPQPPSQFTPECLNDTFLKQRLCEREREREIVVRRLSRRFSAHVPNMRRIASRGSPLGP